MPWLATLTRALGLDPEGRDLEAERVVVGGERDLLQALDHPQEPVMGLVLEQEGLSPRSHRVDRRTRRRHHVDLTTGSAVPLLCRSLRGNGLCPGCGDGSCLRCGTASFVGIAKSGCGGVDPGERQHDGTEHDPRAPRWSGRRSGRAGA
jgi:hypothetical protein